MDIVAVVPVLRMFDVATARRFYVDWLGCAVDWADERPDGPVYLQVSRDGVVLHLSSHHDDGTPGSVVLIEVRDLEGLHAELRDRPYPFFNPGLEPHPAGRELQVIDPSSNRLRFFERAPSDDPATAT